MLTADMPRTVDNCPFTLAAATSTSGLSRAHQRVLPHSNLVGAGGFAKRRAQVPATWDKTPPRNKNSWKLNFRNSFFSCPGTNLARYEGTIQCTSIVTDNPVPRVPTWVASTSKKLNLASLLASFGLYIYLLPAQRLHFPPRSSRITIAQAASEARGNEPQGCPLHVRLTLSVCVVYGSCCMDRAS